MQIFYFPTRREMWSLETKKQKKKKSSVPTIASTRGCPTTCTTSSASAMLVFESMEYLTRAETTLA